MSSPIVESLCCVPEASDLTEYFLSTFRTKEYNIVCLVASLLGIAGAIYQVWKHVARIVIVVRFVIITGLLL